MWNFNNVGRVVNETVLHRGLIARLTSVWSWKRKSVSEGRKYLVTVTNPQGVEIYSHSHTHDVLFKYVVNKYQTDVSPLKTWKEDVDVRAFSLGTALEDYLSKDLPDGTFLVMVPGNKKVIEDFWKEKADEVSMDHSDHHLDGYVADITTFSGPLLDLIADSYVKYPGRYFLVVMKDGFAQSTEDLT